MQGDRISTRKKIKGLFGMKEKFKTILKAGAAFLATHLVCCSPLILPAAFGLAISGAYLGAISLAAIATIYATSFFVHRKNNPIKAHQCHSKSKGRKLYLKSKSFKNSSILTGSILLGTIFNQFSVHDHNHEDHHHMAPHSTSVELTEKSPTETPLPNVPHKNMLKK